MSDFQSPHSTAFTPISPAERYAQALALSTVYQGGVVAWVAFWAIYGQGFAGISGIATFGAAYMLVVLIEPLVDLAGLSLPVTLSVGEKKQRTEFAEDLLFTHRGLSGPAVLQISSYWQPGQTLHINLVPDCDLAAESV